MSLFNNSDLQRYHSGFIGKRIPLSHGEGLDSKIARHIQSIQYNKSPQKTETGFDYNEEVELLFQQLIKEPKTTSDFNFHENVIKIAKSAFGIHITEQLFLVQSQSPSVSSLHADFLIDTMRFIRHGKREINTSSWNALLKSPTQVNDWYDIKAEVKEFIQIVDCPTLSKLIVKWVSQKNGIYDLLNTLHVMYGK